MSRTALYRHFDAEGALLYVGISLHAVRRLEQHKTSAHWFARIRRVDVEWFDTRAMALAAEAAAIVAENPVCNRMRPAGAVISRQDARPQRQPEGVLHVGSGRIDGWYFDGSATHMRGWFAAMFPQDEFRVVRPTAETQELSDDKYLDWGEHVFWARTRTPNYAAADAFDERAAA